MSLRSATMTVVAMATALASLSPAWSCVPGSPLPFVVLEPASFGPAGSQITVQGLHFLEAPIEVRWKGLDGPRLQTATGPDFSSSVTVPEEPPGLYELVVLSRRSDGSIADATRATFQVTGAHNGGQGSNVDGGGARAAGDASSTTSSVTDNLLLVLLSGVVLVVLGGLGGARLARRRKR